MRVLVTRPRHAAERTARRLVRLGHQPLIFPLAEPVGDPSAALQALAGNDLPLIVTSAEAARTLEDERDRLAPYLDRPLYAVGDATARAARQAGFRNVTAARGDGAGLAEHLVAEGIGAALYLAGSPRAATLEMRAAELHLHIDIAECYEMRPLGQSRESLDRSTGGPVDAVLLYSARTAQAFFTFAAGAPDFDAARFLCFSEAIARVVPPAYRRQVFVAPAPDEKSLFSLL